jgi:acyl dehydratase
MHAAHTPLDVGTEFETARRQITEGDVRAYAALSGDLHLHNVDSDFAEKTVFGRRVVQGMLVLGCAIGLVPIDSEQIVAARRIEHAIFKRPVYLDDSIQVRGRITRLIAFRNGLAIATAALNVMRGDRRTAVVARVDFLCTGEGLGAEHFG